MVDSGSWIIGTPDDCVEAIKRLDEQSRRVSAGSLSRPLTGLPREKMLRSYELLARYVMPQFQGSLVGTQASNQWAAERQDTLVAGRTRALDRARQVYADQRAR